MRREAADKAEQGESACTLSQRGLGNIGSDGTWAGVLSRGHGSMVASRVFQGMDTGIETKREARRSWRESVVRFWKRINVTCKICKIPMKELKGHIYHKRRKWKCHRCGRVRMQEQKTA